MFYTAGIDESYRINNNFTWHHHEDGTTMQLISKDIHLFVRHTGGAAKIKGL